MEPSLHTNKQQQWEVAGQTESREKDGGAGWTVAPVSAGSAVVSGTIKEQLEELWAAHRISVVQQTRCSRWA